MTSSKLIHIVDDEEPICRSLELLLRRSGYRVRKWLDGSTFLKGADPSDPACVVLDIRMPGLDGLEVQAEMARLGLNLPVVFMTGHEGFAVPVSVSRSDAIACLEKPFKSDELFCALEAGFNQLANRISAQRRSSWGRTWVVPLTALEQEVLDGLACGYSHRIIARDLGISPHRVEVLRANTMEKLEITNFADALRIAFGAGLGLEKDWRQRHATGTLRTPHHIAAKRPASISVAGSLEI